MARWGANEKQSSPDSVERPNRKVQEFLQSIGLSDSVLISISAIGLAISIIVEQAQLIAKYRGVAQKKVAGGYNAAMKIMVLNRFGAVMYFLLISLSIDLGMRAERIGKFFVFAILGVGVFNFCVIIKLIQENKLRVCEVFFEGVRSTPIIMSMIAALFGILGLTFPMLLSAENPDLRLTMANTGFLLNTVFTIITVFFVESHLAEIIDNPKQQHRTIHFVTAVFLMRFLGALIASAFMLFLVENIWLLNAHYWF